MRQDADGSAPMLGSQPVAWSVGNPALVNGIARAVSVHPQRKWAEASARHSGVSEDHILPLYLAPTLTDEEREAIGLARSVLDSHYRMSRAHNEADEVLERMVERLG